MEQIELVVKIPKEVYEIIKNVEPPTTLLVSTIKNGIPLPKGRKQVLSDEVADYIKSINKYSDVCNDCAYTIASTVRDMAEKYIVGSDKEGADAHADAQD